MRTRLLGMLALLLPMAAAAQQAMDLSGEWLCTLQDDKDFKKTITLPGTLDEAGIGEPHALVPMLRKPQMSRLTRKHTFIGQACYQREIAITDEMANRPLLLSLERVMWKSRVMIDGQDIGQVQESLVAPHRFTISGLKAGKHRLTLCIDNTKQHDISVDDLAHSYTNDTQIMWNGVLGKMELGLLPEISDVQVYPDIKRTRATVRVVGNADTYRFMLNGQRVRPEQKRPGEYTLHLPEPRLWDEFSPYLYTLTVETRQTQKTVTFGMREITTEGNKLLVNGRPVFLRGTLECCVFPLTGTPPTDEQGWMKVFTTAREYGLNHLRFHSWCPPEAAFSVADKMGFYCQVELPNWSLTVNRDSATARFLYAEADRILAHYGNHPSLCIVSCGNELQPDFGFLNKLTKHMRQQDARHLYVTSTFTFEQGHGRQPEPEDDIFITQWTDKGWVRGQGIFDEHAPEFMGDYREAAAGLAVPLVSHEIGQYSVFPNIREIEKYTGVLDPLNLKAIREDLQAKGLAAKAGDYLKASGRLAALLYKEEIERALKTPQQSGFQLLDLHDFPGQGTALVGLLDAFWDSKGLVEPQRFREFCAPVVPLARFKKATWQNYETFTAGLEVADYSDETKPVGEDSLWHWKLTDDQGRVYADGTGSKVSVSLENVDKAMRMELLVSIADTPWRNRWSIWVYPTSTSSKLEALNRQILVTQNADEAIKALKKGKKVLFSPPLSQVKGLEGKFLPVFWSPVHFPKQAGTMGLLCHPGHAALRHFPTDINSDWQWWQPVKHSRVMVLDSIPEVTPIVESVDNFMHNRCLAQIFEAKVGRGSLVMSSIDLTLTGIPEIRQLRYSLQQYMADGDFAPQHEVSPADILRLLQESKAEAKTTATSIYD